VCNPFPVFHINCLDSAVLPALVTGCTAVIFEGFHASTFWQTVRQQGATVVSVIPTVIRGLLSQAVAEGEGDHRVRLVSGSLRPKEHELEGFLRRYAIPSYETGYGLTEAGNAVTGTSAELGCRPPSMGIPLFDRTVELWDETGKPVPTGESGELVVKCEPASGVMSGYWADPAATEEALAGGWLHTGDLARRQADGSFYFVGRLKDVIKRSGENIGAQEVEAVIVEHPAVREAAVLGVPDDYRDEAVMACVIVNEGFQAPGIADLRSFCRGRLADFKIPTALEVMDEFPRGLLGKVDKKALRQLVTAAAAVAPEDKR
jgi:crotonobetaine/carnitine-CoA ligase